MSEDINVNPDSITDQFSEWSDQHLAELHRRFWNYAIARGEEPRVWTEEEAVADNSYWQKYQATNLSEHNMLRKKETNVVYFSAKVWAVIACVLTTVSVVFLFWILA